METTPTKTPKGPTLRQFQARFPTEDSCLEHLKLVRYGAKHACAKCEREAKYYRVKARRSYECEHCGHSEDSDTAWAKVRTREAKLSAEARPKTEIAHDSAPF